MANAKVRLVFCSRSSMTDMRKRLSLPLRSTTRVIPSLRWGLDAHNGERIVGGTRGKQRCAAVAGRFITDVIENRVDPRWTFRWRRCSTSIALMIALVKIPRATRRSRPRRRSSRHASFISWRRFSPPAPAARREAEVVLSIDVDETGKVGAVEVAKPAGGEGGEALDARPSRRLGSLSSSRERPTDIRSPCALRIAIGSCSSPLCVRRLRPPPRGEAPRVPAVAAVGHRAPAGRSHGRRGRGRARHRRTGRRAAGRHRRAGAILVRARSPWASTSWRCVARRFCPSTSRSRCTKGRSTSSACTSTSRSATPPPCAGSAPSSRRSSRRSPPRRSSSIPGTQGDTLKAVQNLPGVARAPFGIGLLPVWGSAPADTRVYVDGVNIPVLYHFGGLRSTVQQRDDRRAHLRARRRIRPTTGSAWAASSTSRRRRPRTDGLHGYAQMDLARRLAHARGAASRKTLSFAVAGRRSWIDATLPLFTTSTFQLSPVYYDYQARLSWRPTSGRDVVDLFLFGSDDQLSLLARVKNDALDATVDSHTFFHRAVLSWAHRLRSRGGTLTVTSSVGYDAPFGLGVAFGQTPTSLDERTFAYATRAVAPLADQRARSGSTAASTSRGTAGRSTASARPRSSPIWWAAPAPAGWARAAASAARAAATPSTT